MKKKQKTDLSVRLLVKLQNSLDETNKSHSSLLRNSFSSELIFLTDKSAASAHSLLYISSDSPSSTKYLLANNF